MATWYDFFHRHIEKCKQCSGSVFNLCLMGATMLQNAADEAARDVMQPPPPPPTKE